MQSETHLSPNASELLDNGGFWPNVNGNLECVNLGLLRECLGSASSVETYFFSEFESRAREVKLASEVRALCILGEMQRHPELWAQLVADGTIVVPNNTSKDQGRIMGLLRAISYRPNDEPYSTAVSRSATAVRGIAVLCEGWGIGPSIALAGTIYNRVRIYTQKQLHEVARHQARPESETVAPAVPENAALEAQLLSSPAQLPVASVSEKAGQSNAIVPSGPTPTDTQMEHTARKALEDDDLTLDFVEVGTLSGPTIEALSTEYSVLLVRKGPDHARGYLVASGRSATLSVTQFLMALDTPEGK